MASTDMEIFGSFIDQNMISIYSPDGTNFCDSRTMQFEGSRLV